MLYFIKVTVNRVSFKVTLGKTLFFMKKTGELFTIAGQGGRSIHFIHCFIQGKDQLWSSLVTLQVTENS